MQNNNITKLRSQLCKVAQEVGDTFDASSFAGFCIACEKLDELQRQHTELTGRDFAFEIDPEWDDYQCALHVAEEALKGQGELL